MSEQDPAQFPFEDPNVDSDALDQALRNLPAEPMPDDVWASLQATIAAESAQRSAATAPGASRSSGRGRWLLVAAAAAAVVVVGGVWINAKDNPPQPVATANLADDATESSMAAASGALSAPPVDAAAPSESSMQSVQATPRSNGGAVVQNASFPVRRVMATQTNYAKDSMPAQVGALLSTAGVRSSGDIEKALPVDAQPTPVGTNGFTATMEGLRSCVTAITKNAAAQALVIDRALFEGNDAGIVVMPAGSGGPDSATPTMTTETEAGPLDVWVVEPDCAVVDPHVMLHMLHELVTEATNSTDVPSGTASPAGQSADASTTP